MKHIITMFSIRPDWIRGSELIKKLDDKFKHTLIHTGQHFDFNLSNYFFKDLNIREPDYNFSIGEVSSDHFEQLSNISLKLKEYQDLIMSADLVLFLGDSNSVLASLLVKKMGVNVGHIEAGMRSGDISMFEEINRKICDHCSDIHFCYHKNYARNLFDEGINEKFVYITGNTISEVIKKVVPKEDKKNDYIIVDIHRQENFNNANRLNNIIKFSEKAGKLLNRPVYLLNFKRTISQLNKFNILLNNIQLKDLMNFKDYVYDAYHSYMIISDSGTAQEELAFLKTPVLVPRDYTERWESVYNKCSIMIDVNQEITDFSCLEKINELTYDTRWLGDGNTSDLIIDGIEDFLND